NHRACAAAIAVLEIIQDEYLVANARDVGGYVVDGLKRFDKKKEIRGGGLRIGIELPEELSGVKNDLLTKNRIFTGEAKPNTIRLLPALNITKDTADVFLSALDERLKAV